MSMRENPGSGYVVPLEQLKSILPEGKQDEFEELLLNIDEEPEAVTVFLEENLSVKFPSFTVYCPADEDTVDENMENGKYYAIFDESDLFVKRPTPQHEAMKKLGVTPEYARWSVWG